jgi:hypothetical protein
MRCRLVVAKVHPVNSHHVVFESHHAIQNQILGLRHKMTARHPYHVAKVLQMKILNMAP